MKTPLRPRAAHHSVNSTKAPRPIVELQRVAPAAILDAGFS
jgi:hypothetical protein